MNAFDMSRKLAKIDESTIRKIGVESVIDNADIVISDAIASNIEGLTFASNQIAKTKPFSDWEETGEFHDNLKFESENDIAFVSSGKGAEAIFSTFPEKDTIAPTAKILGREAIYDIKTSFTQKVKAL